MNNPWNLTEQESKVLTLLVKSGINKLVARELEVEARTVECHLWNARQKMGASNRLLAALEFDRWARTQEAS